MEKERSLFCSFMKTGNFRAGQGSCPHMERVIIWCIKMGFFFGTENKSHPEIPAPVQTLLTCASLWLKLHFSPNITSGLELASNFNET